MLALNFVAFGYLLFHVCDASYVDTLPKCSFKDGECIQSMYRKLIKDGKNGLPEFDIPRLDPLEVKNVTMSLMDGIAITLVDGVLKGVSDSCVYSNSEIDVDKKMISQEFLCNLTIKGIVKVTGSNQAMQALIGSPNVDSQGKAKLKLVNLKAKYDMPIKLLKKDGEIYMKMEDKGVKFIYDLESASLVVEKVFIGNNDISQILMTFFSENWRTLFKSYARKILELGTEIYVSICNKFNKAVSMDHYIIEDLTQYLEN